MLGEQASVSENGTVKTPRRPREYLTEGEIDRLMTIARQSDRYGHRDATAILVAFRHGLRSSELVAWNGTRSTSPARPSGYGG